MEKAKVYVLRNQRTKKYLAYKGEDGKKDLVMLDLQ
jgi:hypothetical protein